MIRFGIVGTGWISDQFIQAARLTGDFILSAVYSRTRDRAEEFAAKYSVGHVFTDLEELASSRLIDAVYIASPNSCHAQQAILFLNHGKHVLCEKPIASNGNELSAMILAAEKNQVLLMEALKTLLLPNFQSVRNNLYRIGPVRRFLCIKCQYSSRYDAYKEGRETNTFNPAYSNGSLMDIGVYCLYPIVYLFGQPKSLQANAVMLGSGVDGEGTVLLKYDAMEAVAIHSKIADTSLASEIQGETGTIVIDKISTPEAVNIIYRNGKRETLTQQQLSKTMYYEAKEFIGLIKSNRLQSTVNSYRLSLDVMEILDSARRQIGLVFPADGPALRQQGQGGGSYVKSGF